jgi:hypothetical protein
MHLSRSTPRRIDPILAALRICPKCFVTIVTGYVGEGHTFIHDMRDELLVAAAMVEKLTIILPRPLTAAMPPSKGTGVNLLDQIGLKRPDLTLPTMNASLNPSGGRFCFLVRRVYFRRGLARAGRIQSTVPPLGLGARCM